MHETLVGLCEGPAGACGAARDGNASLKGILVFPSRPPQRPAKLQRWAVTDGGGVIGLLERKCGVAAYDWFNLYLFSDLSKVALLVPAQVRYHRVTTLHQQTPHTHTHTHT